MMVFFVVVVMVMTMIIMIMVMAIMTMMTVVMITISCFGKGSGLHGNRKRPTHRDKISARAEVRPPRPSLS